MKLLNFLSGKKTYIIIGVEILFGVLQGLNVYTISTEGWIVLFALGLGAHRAGIAKVGKAVAEIKNKQF